MYGEIRRWVEELPVAELFDLDDLQRAFPDKSRDAIKMTVSRLCRRDAPVVVGHICRGLYCRGLLGKYKRVPIPYQAYREARWRIAGPGAGYTGPNIINSLNWSTQVPMVDNIVVVGRAPRYKELPDTYFYARSNEKRLDLTRWEVSLLEAARCFDAWAETSWSEATTKLEGLVERGYVNRALRRDRFLDVARAERGLGTDFVPRCEELADITCATRAVV